jgi:hypothetical protein
MIKVNPVPGEQIPGHAQIDDGTNILFIFDLWSSFYIKFEINFLPLSFSSSRLYNCQSGCNQDFFSARCGE